MSNNIPDSLKKAFANKTIIPLVGAGVSMSLMNKDGERLFPSWRELLERAAKKLISENKQNHANAITGALGIDDYQGAADYARKGLAGGLWNKFFKENFSIKRDDIKDESLLLPRAIWTLSERIITLNYDRVMRFSCPTSDDVLELDNTTKGELADFKSNNNKPTVWHLHGKIDNLEKIILTSESYNKFYLDNDLDYRAALTTFNALCSTTTLVFIGCSLDDAELLQLLGSQHDIFSGNTGPHYALVREVDKALIQTKLTGLPIELISFADFGQPLLDVITAISTPTNETTVIPTVIAKVEAPVSAAVTLTKRIAILTANPIGENYDYRALTTEFEKLNCEINYYPLTIKVLNDLENFDYIFILSKLIKNNIVIEDEALQSARSNFKNIEDNIGNINTKGVFIFLDYATKAALDLLDISADIATLQLPILIFPSLDKSQLSGFYYQYFRKKNIDFISESIISNPDDFQISELKGTRKKNKNISRLSESIDKKNTEQYLGRKTDLQNLCREIVALQGRDEILTIKGAGGIGKTATVKKIAVALAERFLFSGGIDFVDCEFIDDYSSLEKKLAACFNLENALDIPKEIKSKISKQDKLIILDNVETLLHLQDTNKIKNFIYFICDYVSIVITTREILDLSCEKVIELNRYSSDDAYALFIKYLRREPKDATERRIIRQDIVEELLDNNPLAIKLVASNLPTSKKMQELKHELEEDVFRKASAVELSDLDSLSDINIERKKSLYASINFSYKNLDEVEKKAFEILSLFPDGIHMNALKVIAGERKTLLRKSSANTDKLRVQSPVITDTIIRNLENKSIIQIDNQIIKLQSIMGKFAERQLKKRKANELSNYYQRASDYHIQFAEYLCDVIREDVAVRGASLFNQQQANFFKSINYLHEANISNEILLIYLENLNWLAITTTQAENFSRVLMNSKNIKLLLQNEDAQLCFELIILHIDYYAGNFSRSFSSLQKIIPISELQDFVPKSEIEKIIRRIATNIYGMEGELLTELRSDILRRAQYGSYPITLFQLGEINSTLLLVKDTGIYSLEAKLSLGMLVDHAVDNCIASTYEKDHLSLMQIYYIKAKLNLANKKLIDDKQIQSLVIVNPYTRGLQQLMLAFARDIPTEAIALYDQALSNLTHIKYYYVEALLYYARYLQQQNMHSQFNIIHQQGYDLACKHYYRWLRYEFEGLVEKKTQPYNSADYPLPEDLDIKSYIQWLIKQNQNS